MRWLTLLVIGLWSAGCGTRDCKPNTVLATLSFDSVASGADGVDVVVELAGHGQHSVSLPGPGGKSTATVEVEFPSGYTAGESLSVTVSARKIGGEIAHGQASVTLAAGCTVLPIAVAGGAGDDSVPADMLQVPVAMAKATPDLVGFTTTLDGSGSTDPLGQALTFAWKVSQTPTGSSINDASLASASTAKTTFSPDRGGLYKLTLTVTAADHRSGQTVLDVTVPTLPVFYTRSTTTGETLTVGPAVMQSDGTGDHAVGCGLQSDGGLRPSDVDLVGNFGARSWEPLTQSPTAKLAFLQVADLSGANPPELHVASATSDCASSPPVRVDTSMFTDHVPVAARFSPDGTRIVYVDMPQDSSSASFRLVTVAADGVGPRRVIRSEGVFGLTPPAWIDNQTVAWIERDSSSSNPFSLFKAPDQNGAGQPPSGMRSTLLRCDKSVDATHLDSVSQIEITPFGVIAAGSPDIRCTALCNRPFAAVNLYRMAPNDCSVTTAKTLASEQRGGMSWDFSVSPDGLSVLFSSTHGTVIPDGGTTVTPQQDIWVVPSDGSSAAKSFVGDPNLDDVGPHFLAGGRQFIWSQLTHDDMSTGGRTLMIANSDGTHVRVLTPSAPGGQTVLAANAGLNRAFECSLSSGEGMAGGFGALFSLLCGYLLTVALRRRAR